MLLKQMVNLLLDNKHLYYDLVKGKWCWELKDLIDLNVPKDLKDIINGKINSLDHRQKELLEILSCIGGKFDMELLEKIHVGSKNQMAETLQALCHAGLIVENLENLKFEATQEFQFFHDEIYQTVYEQIEPEKKDALLKTNGLLALSKTVREEALEIFDNILIGHDYALKELAIYCLSLIDTPWSLDVLTKLANEGDERLKLSIVYALGNSKNENAIDGLFALYDEEDYDHSVRIILLIEEKLGIVDDGFIKNLLDLSKYNKSTERFKLGKTIIISDKTNRIDPIAFCKLPKENRISLKNLEELETLVILEWGDYQVGTYSNNTKACVETCKVSIIDLKSNKLFASKQFEGGQPPFVIHLFGYVEKFMGNPSDYDEMIGYIMKFN